MAGGGGSRCGGLGARRGGGPGALAPARAAGGGRALGSSADALAGRGDLSGVSCVSVGACIAVGDMKNGAGTKVTLAERWNGRRWSVQATPNPAGALSADLGGGS